MEEVNPLRDKFYLPAFAYTASVPSSLVPISSLNHVLNSNDRLNSQPRKYQSASTCLPSLSCSHYNHESNLRSLEPCQEGTTPKRMRIRGEKSAYSPLRHKASSPRNCDEHLECNNTLRHHYYYCDAWYSILWNSGWGIWYKKQWNHIWIYMYDF